jgi:hypothetical protein
MLKMDGSDFAFYKSVRIGDNNAQACGSYTCAASDAVRGGYAMKAAVPWHVMGSVVVIVVLAGMM